MSNLLRISSLEAYRRSQQWDFCCPLLGNKCACIFNYSHFSCPAVTFCIDASVRLHWSNLIKTGNAGKQKQEVIAHSCSLVLLFCNPLLPPNLDCATNRSFLIKGLSLASGFHINYSSLSGICALLKEWHPWHRCWSSFMRSTAGFSS